MKFALNFWSQSKQENWNIVTYAQIWSKNVKLVIQRGRDFDLKPFLFFEIKPKPKNFHSTQIYYLNLLRWLKFFFFNFLFRNKWQLSTTKKELFASNRAHCVVHFIITATFCNCFRFFYFLQTAWICLEYWRITFESLRFLNEYWIDWAIELWMDP